MYFNLIVPYMFLVNVIEIPFITHIWPATLLVVIGTRSWLPNPWALHCVNKFRCTLRTNKQSTRSKFQTVNSPFYTIGYSLNKSWTEFFIGEHSQKTSPHSPPPPSHLSNFFSFSEKIYYFSMAWIYYCRSFFFFTKCYPKRGFIFLNFFDWIKGCSKAKNMIHLSPKFDHVIFTWNIITFT